MKYFTEKGKEPLRSTGHLGKRVNKEWIPPMLRKTRAIPLVLSCWIAALMLEGFNIYVKRHQGISAKNLDNVRAARYLPTVGVVILSFFWKAMASNIKKLVPWSTMSNKTTTASHSVLLDYVNDIEVYSLFIAIQRRHWMVVLTLTAGFLFGALVALANSLTTIHLLAQVTRDADMVQKSFFQPEGSLISPSGSLLMPLNVNGTKPYALVASERLPNGYPAPWTIDGFAFDSFELSEPRTNVTISSRVQAFTADFDCHPLRWEWEIDAAQNGQIVANQDDVTKSGCSNPMLQEFESSDLSEASHYARGWLNLTSCSSDPDDLRILATVAVPTTNDAGNITDAAAAGLICSINFSTQYAQVSVNATIGRITSYELEPAIQPVDLKTPIEALWIYLNDPLDPQIQTGFTQDTDGPKGVKKTLNATMNDVLTAVNRNQRKYGVDPFFNLLTNGHFELEAPSYLKDSNLLKFDVDELAKNILVQVINAFSRKPTAQPIKGTFSVGGPRLFLRQAPLRAMQGVFVLIGIIGALHIYYRPKTILKEDPGSIAATAVVLAASNPKTERVFARTATFDEHEINSSLGSSKCTLREGPDGNALSLEITDTPDNFNPRYSSLHGSNRYSILNHQGWQPLALRLSSKILIVISFCAVMLSLAVLQHKSWKARGLIPDVSSAALILSMTTTSILVLLGYTASGVDSSVREMSPYRSLRQASYRTPLLSNPREIPIIWVPFHAASRRAGFAMLASSAVILTFPAIKILAAGLYVETLQPFTQTITAQVDSSLMNYFESTFKSVHPSTVAQRAAQFSEWSLVPTLNLPTRSGIIENLVFSNLTTYEPNMDDTMNMGGQISIRVPAVAVDIDCIVLDNSDFRVEGTFANETISLSLVCATDKCKQVVNQTTSIFRLTGDPGEYHGTATLMDPRAGTNAFSFNSDASYLVTLADFTSITTPIGSSTPISPAGTIITPGMLNVSLPTARVASCSRTISEVNVDAIFTRSIVSGLNGTETFLPWSPSSFVRSSMEYKRAYNKIMPNWFAPASLTKSEYPKGSPQDGLLAGPELWPTVASSKNIFETIADFSHFKRRNVTSLLDAESFGSAVETMYTTYCTQVLTELRPFALNLSTTGTQPASGAFSFYHPRIVMNLVNTIVVEVLLLLAMACFLWVFIRYPHRPIVPKPPGTIASRFSHLADSSLIRQLREEKVDRTKDTQIWRQTSSLGWWEQKTEDGYRIGWRWGIDLGYAFEKRWDRLPSADPEPYHGGSRSDFELTMLTPGIDQGQFAEDVALLRPTLKE